MTSEDITTAREDGARAAATKMLQRLNEVLEEYGIERCPNPDAASVEELKAKVQHLLDGLPSDKMRRKVLHKVRRMIDRDEVSVRAMRDAHIMRRDRLTAGIEAAERVLEWVKRPLVFQKPVGSLLHDFRRALSDGDVFNGQSSSIDVEPAQVEEWAELIDSSSLFMVEHDWAAAFKNAQDFATGEIRLPDDVCAFEFRITDRHVIVFSIQADGIPYQQMALQVKGGWLLTPPATIYQDSWLEPITNAVWGQIRAVAIALDAEVAVTETVRAPHKLNHARERRGHLPLYSYHVIKLAQRARASALPAVEAEGEKRRGVRLHFRRGHWRHFEDHKTWIKWMLVGDPALGFIEKEYRL